MTLPQVFQWNVLHLLLTIAGTQGVFLLTSDKQYAQLQVNITSVTLTPRTDPISVIENVTQRFRCETSRCRPDALITWFLGSTQLTAAIESSTSQEVTTSTIDHTPQKNQHDMNIFCRGDNGDGPNEPVCKLGGLPLSSAVTVKEGWEFRLDCSSDGNPSPSFSWTHPGDGPSYPLFIRSINRTHAGIFRIIARSNLIPSEQKAVNLTKDIYVKVEIHQIYRAAASDRLPYHQTSYLQYAEILSQSPAHVIATRHPHTRGLLPEFPPQLLAKVLTSSFRKRLR
ncbi:hypothetical protein MAR_021986 [Mya arenaria]|uniref:Immunoglobulin domain-containing protein n=1 Tax=Mya arenaria TaxID=6604 RepID=A0ABY7ECE2_MYAAR|nr:hypothetical protein MAR_021986 [Mya arenaria]